MLMVVGENHPRASNTLEMSDSRNLLVTLLSSLNSRRKESDLVSHCMPNVLAIPAPEDKTSSASLRVDGMDSKTWVSLEFHFLNWKQALEKSCWSSSLSVMGVCSS